MRSIILNIFIRYMNTCVCIFFHSVFLSLYLVATVQLSCIAAQRRLHVASTAGAGFDVRSVCLKCTHVCECVFVFVIFPERKPPRHHRCCCLGSDCCCVSSKLSAQQCTVNITASNTTTTTTPSSTTGALSQSTYTSRLRQMRDGVVDIVQSKSIAHIHPKRTSKQTLTETPPKIAHVRVVCNIFVLRCAAVQANVMYVVELVSTRNSTNRPLPHPLSPTPNIHTCFRHCVHFDACEFFTSCERRLFC